MLAQSAGIYMGLGSGMPLLGDPTVELHSQLIFMLRNDPHVR
jgi:hypothetical protein